MKVSVLSREKLFYYTETRILNPRITFRDNSCSIREGIAKSKSHELESLTLNKISLWLYREHYRQMSTSQLVLESDKELRMQCQKDFCNEIS